ncbi:hypothetical protein E2562_033301 [Oryza meyeriana var. granulata]|uniref:Uncharacterized protein n=1 Tax=Oryza meyeriana var. granulata TaxID=110450 RepID=A0A6G1F0X7_9ORYZ|nr:hypothetical protein E2562_033301 [Oryza meyeriana var. granulata]
MRCAPATRGPALRRLEPSSITLPRTTSSAPTAASLGTAVVAAPLHDHYTVQLYTRCPSVLDLAALLEVASKSSGDCGGASGEQWHAHSPLGLFVSDRKYYQQQHARNPQLEQRARLRSGSGSFGCGQSTLAMAASCSAGDATLRWPPATLTTSHSVGLATGSGRVRRWKQKLGAWTKHPGGGRPPR